MKYQDLRDFLAQLERLGELKRIGIEVDPRLEMTEICDRVLRAAQRRGHMQWRVAERAARGRQAPGLSQGA